MGKFSSNKSGDICQSTAVDDVNGSPPAPDSSSTFNHSLWDYCNGILLYKLWPCVPPPQSLATHYSLSKQAIARGRDRYREEERSHWPLCPSYLPSFPSTPILRVKSSDPRLTVNWLVMVAKPADINQSDFSPRPSEGCFARAYHLTQLLSCFWSLKKKTWLWSNVCLGDSQTHPRVNQKEKEYIYI